MLTISSQAIAMAIISTFLIQPSLIAATITPKTGRFEECGAETFNQGRHKDCGVELYQLIASSSCPAIYGRSSDFGVESYNSGRGEPCGAESYRQGTSGWACGVAYSEFWTGWSISAHCPNPRVSQRTGPNGEMYFVGIDPNPIKKEMRMDGFNVQFRVRCKEFKENSCRHEAFGVEQWRECSHPSFGVAAYNQGIIGYNPCRSSDHPVELYNICAHSSFGAATYKECSLYKTNQELGQYLEDVKTFMPIHANSMYANAGTFLEMLGSTSSIGCLIKSADSDPLTKTMADKLRETFSRLAGRAYTNEDGNFCDGVSPFYEVERFPCEGDSPMCKAKASYIESRNILTESSDNLRLLLGDLIATRDASVSNKISEQITAIEKLMKGE